MNLYDPATLHKFLSRHGLSPTKGLGQHFLCSETVVGAIVASLDGINGLLEIGPGPGVLTAPLSARTERMVALELDPRMVAALMESAPAADVRQADALQTDICAILKELPEPRGVVSNLPYYITAPLLTRISEARGHFGKAVLMMQKEVAQRVLAGPGNSDRGSLSVYLQACFSLRKLADAPAEAFLPPPKVDSTVLELVPTAEDDDPALFRLVRGGFTQPRKTLANNLSSSLSLPREQVLRAIGEAGLGEKARPADLTLENWRTLFQWLKL